MNRTKRKSGIELLRIIAIMQIIFLHVCDYGGLRSASQQYGTLDYTLVEGIWSFCRAPVDVFMMISGYFLVTSQFNIKKSIRRAGKVYPAMIFYSLVLAAVFFVIDPSLINVENIVKAFTPMLSRTWYFLCNYIIILLLSPFINKLLMSVTKKQCLYMIGIIFLVVSLWSTLASVRGLENVLDVKKVTDPYLGKSLWGFLLSYLMGAYVRLHIPESEEADGKKSGVKLGYLAAFVLLCLVDFTISRIFTEYHRVFGAFNNPLVLCEGVMLLLFFRDFKFHSGFINTVAGTTLGIYAIHEDPYVRDWLWNTFSFKSSAMYDTLMYIPAALAAVVAVFAVCCIIELLRLKLFDLVGKAITALKTRGSQKI